MYIVHYFTLWQLFSSKDELVKWLEVNSSGVKAIYKIDSEVTKEFI